VEERPATYNSSTEGLQARPSVLDAFVSNPLVFLVGAFVGIMELDVSSADSEIAKVLRGVPSER